MTVQAGIEVETDLELLVGEFEQLSCESKDHGVDTKFHDGGPATHYAQFFHACHGPIGEIRAICAKSAASMQRLATSTAVCRRCKEKGQLSTFMIVLGPINSSTR